MLKKLLVGTAVTAALMTPGLTSADTSGSIGLSYEHNDFDYSSNGEFQGYNLGGAIIHDLSDTLTLQADGRTTLQDWDCCDSYYSQGYAAAHLSTDLGSWDLGGFAGFVNYYGEGGVLIGAEARTALGNFSLDGAYSLTDFAENGAYGTAARLGGAFFINPNFAVTAGAGYSWIDGSGSTEYDITELSLGGAYQFANNIELYGGYTNTDAERSTGTEYEGDTFQLGVRFNVGGGTLQDNTNDGAWWSAEHVSDTWNRW